MNQETTRSSLEPSVCAVARTSDAAAELAQWLRVAGMVARVGVDLEEILAAAPSILVVDPSGWEKECRRTLAAYDTRPAPPPAVFFTGANPGVIDSAGPAYAFVHPHCEPSELANFAIRALRTRERFTTYWPLTLRSVSGAGRKRVARVLEAATGVAIRPDRETAFLQALLTRMVARLVPSAHEYAELLERTHPEAAAEAETLAALLSVNETYFWRYAGQFLALQGILIPSLIRAKGAAERSLRIWSAGCASGEETYSLAMACLEVLKNGWDVAVVGTDIHRPSLARAQAGVYPRRTLRNLPPRLKRKYLSPTPSGARVADALRQRVGFEFLNLGGELLDDWIAKNGPFDAIFCRNTLMYFDRLAADRVLDRLQAGLTEGGGLFLGAAETVYPRRTGLETVRGMGSFFYRRCVQPTPAPVEPPKNEDSAAVETRAARLYEAGLAHLDVEDFHGAEKAFGEILGLCPDDARGHTGLALLLANDGREAEAADRLNKAAEGSPVLAETRYLLGLVAERQGRDTEALRHYRDALGVAPGFFMAHINRAWMLQRAGRRAAFLEEMGSALRILRERPQVAPWITGGMGWEALFGLVAEALNGESLS